MFSSSCVVHRARRRRRVQRRPPKRRRRLRRSARRRRRSGERPRRKRSRCGGENDDTSCCLAALSACMYVAHRLLAKRHIATDHRGVLGSACGRSTTVLKILVVWYCWVLQQICALMRDHAPCHCAGEAEAHEPSGAGEVPGAQGKGGAGATVAQDWQRPQCGTPVTLRVGSCRSGWKSVDPEASAWPDGCTKLV